MVSYLKPQIIIKPQTQTTGGSCKKSKKFQKTSFGGHFMPLLGPKPKTQK